MVAGATSDAPQKLATAFTVVPSIAANIHCGDVIGSEAEIAGACTYILKSRWQSAALWGWCSMYQFQGVSAFNVVDMGSGGGASITSDISEFQRTLLVVCAFVNLFVLILAIVCELQRALL